MNMVEKVARALARSELTALGKEAFDKNINYYTDCFSKADRDMFEGKARIAIEAMHEPTEGMLTSVCNDDRSKDNANSIYIVMIDAALKE